MRFAAFFLLAASALQLEITDARGKKASGVAIEVESPDADDWYVLKITKSKGNAVIVWPFDGRAKTPDGPAPVPVIVIPPGDEKALANQRLLAALVTPVLLGTATIEETARRTGFDTAALTKAIAGLATSSDYFEKGVGLLYARKPADAVDPLARALRERERQLTRIPSEIYPAAMLYGRALFEANKFDDAAVTYQKALNLRPSDDAAQKARAEALVKAGKPEAAEQVLKKRAN